MFIPKTFAMTDKETQHKFIKEFGFGIVIANTHSLSATHLPFVLEAEQGDHGVLYAHCAKANPLWKNLQDQEVLVIFTGPHSYISPSLYTNAPAVPTWNYTAVHAYGTASLLDSTDTLKAVDQVVAQYEPQLLEKRDIVTEDITQKLLSGIVGIKIEIKKLEGKLKLGQNKNNQDQAKVFEALSCSKNLDDQALAKYMQQIKVGIGQS